MNIKKLIFSFLTGILAVGSVQAQILDDSTKSVYGPNTTRYFYENNLKYNQQQYQTIDTTLTDIHEFTIPMLSGGRFKDLGNVGTALKPVYFMMPEQIGITSGYDAYQAYFESPEKIRYYDTRSPYSKVKTFVAARGRSITDIDLSRNINPQWNLATRFTMLTADKQIFPNRSRGDRNVNSVAYQLSVRHESKDKKYAMLAHFSRLSHKVNEQGGIAADSLSDYFLYTQANILLDNGTLPQNRDLTINYHFYNQYKLNDILQAYYSFDKRMQKITFNDDNISSEKDVAFYRTDGLVSPSVTADSSRFDVMKHEIGLKGDIGEFFYNIYYKQRNFKYQTDYIGRVFNENEDYGGFNIRYDFNEHTDLGAGAEYMLNGNYKAKANLRHKMLNVSYSRAVYAPSAMTQRYFGNHYHWDNNFEMIKADQLIAAAAFRLPFLEVRPHVTVSNINRPVYFDQDRKPVQAEGSAQMIAPGLKLHLLMFKKLHLETDAIYATVGGDASKAYPVPEVMANARLYYETPVFDGALYGQFGVEGHYQSAYYSQAYDPVTMQYYLQDDFILPDYLTADLFFNARIGSANLFVKWENFNQMISQTGYFAAPYFTAPKSSFAFGVDWKFFD